jgi:hypothetical protein
MGAGASAPATAAPRAAVAPTSGAQLEPQPGAEQQPGAPAAPPPALDKRQLAKVHAWFARAARAGAPPASASEAGAGLRPAAARSLKSALSRAARAAAGRAAPGQTAAVSDLAALPGLSLNPLAPRMLAAFDANRDGRLSEGEWVAAVAAFAAPAGREALYRSAFRAVDADQVGGKGFAHGFSEGGREGASVLVGALAAALQRTAPARARARSPTASPPAACVPCTAARTG